MQVMANFFPFHTTRHKRGYTSDREIIKIQESKSPLMDDTKAGSSTDWFQLYEQTFNGHDDDQVVMTSSFGFTSDNTIVAATAATSASRASSITAASSSQLSPNKGCVSKPIRRRSRASKRTPTTLLHANTTNFRALVQQFTGCPTRSIAFGSQNGPKGPFNLNFGLGRVQNHSNLNTIMASFGNINYNGHQQSQKQQLVQSPQGHHHEQLSQEQQCTASVVDNVPNGAYFPISSDLNPYNYLEMADGFFMEDVSLHEFAGESNFSYENMNEGDIF